MLILFDLLFAVLAADFVTGFVHWLEDSYGNPKWPLIGRHVIAPNMLHHAEPAAMTKNSWLQSAGIPLMLVGVFTGVVAALGALTWQILVFVGVAVNANEIHKWNHMPERRKGWLIRAVQKLPLLQSRKHHAKHHGAAKNTHYCVITNWMNPVLEAIGFWRGLEAAIKFLFGVSKRPDPTVPARFRTLTRQ